jgi:hypothetical protein
VSFPTHSADSHVTEFPLKFFRSNLVPRRKLSFDEVITLIKTDAEFCTRLVLDIHVYCMGDEYYWYGFELGALPDSEIFEDMAQQLLRHDDITERQLAICRMPDENGIPRLARYKQELDEQYEVANQIKLLFDLQALVQAGLSPIEFIEIDGVLWLLENGLPFEECLRARLETLEALEEAEYVTVRRNYHRVTVTGVFLDEEAAADFQNRGTGTMGALVRQPSIE